MAINHINLAGEFYAMHSLFREGYDPALTLGNTKGVDILLYNPKNSRLFKVEVKTSTTIQNEILFGGKNMNWRMHKKHEDIIERNLIYSFVFIPNNRNQPPIIFFIPSQKVAEYVKWEHDYWYKSPHKKEVKHTDMRSFRISLEDKTYENNFSIFE